MNKDEILLQIASNKDALSILPKSICDELIAFKRLHENNVWKEHEMEREKVKAGEDERKKLQEKVDKLFCRGQWGERVPRNRRFALCRREFSGRTEWCAIDLVRGYMSPYWNYYGGDFDRFIPFYKYRIKPLLKASSDDEAARLISMDWNFFKCRDSDLTTPFQVCTHVVDEYDKVTVTGLSKPKTLEEHQKDLEKEFSVGHC